MKKLRSFLTTVVLVLAIGFVFSQQSLRLTGDRQRTYELGYLEGYEHGRETMNKEYESFMKAERHARKLTKAGYEIEN